MAALLQHLSRNQLYELCTRPCQASKPPCWALRLSNIFLTMDGRGYLYLLEGAMQRPWFLEEQISCSTSACRVAPGVSCSIARACHLLFLHLVSHLRPSMQPGSACEVPLLPCEQAMLAVCLALEPVRPVSQTQLEPPLPLAATAAEQAGGSTAEQQQEHESVHSAQQDQQGQPDQQMQQQNVRRSSAHMYFGGR